MKARSLASLFLFWFTVGWMALVRLEAQQTGLPAEVVHYADTVLYNGKILTADPQFTVVEAAAVRDGRFLAVGPSNRILPLAGPKTRRIDLKGKTVTPGIYDMHGDRLASEGLPRHWNRKYLWDEPLWQTKEQAAESLKRIVGRLKPGEPAILMRIDILPKSGKREGGTSGFICNVFTLAEMDALTPNNPVFFISVVNTTTMAMNSKGAEVTKRFLPKGVSTPFLKPNNVCVTGGNLDVDGVLTPGQYAGNDYIYWYEPTGMEPVLSSYREINSEFNAQGIVLGRGHIGVPTLDGTHALWERGELTIRFRMPFPLVPQISGHTTQVPPEEAETLIRRWANMSKIGDNMFRFAGMRIPAVGGNQNSGNTWTLEPKIRPYPDQYGNPAPYGGWAPEQEAMEKGLRETFRGREVLIQACRFGWDTAADHTLGDRAYREVIKAYKECRDTQVVKRANQRNTTGHTPITNADDIKLAAKIGILSNVSTGHLMGTELEQTLTQYGTERVDSYGHMKTFIKEGIHPSLESTFWGTMGSTAFTEKEAAEYKKGFTAFYWVGKAITRKDDHYGRVWGAAEALSRQEALWAGTIWGSEQLDEDKELGNIMVGKEADLVVLDKDYMTIPVDDIVRIKPLLTMVGGKVVYEASGAL